MVQRKVGVQARYGSLLRVLSRDLGIWVPSVLFLWNPFGIILICIVDVVSSVPHLCYKPQEGKSSKRESKQFHGYP